MKASVRKATLGAPSKKPPQTFENKRDSHNPARSSKCGRVKGMSNQYTGVPKVKQGY